MRKTSNECVGCTDMGLPCMGSSCKNRSVTRFYCDDCKEEKELYHFDDDELCIDCIEKRLEKVEL